MKPILSLDIDGVLADERQHLEESKKLACMLRQRGSMESDEECLERMKGVAGWWSERNPIVFNLRDRDVMISLLHHVDLQLVTTRSPSLEGTTMSWVSKHHPWLLLSIKRTFFLGEGGDKTSIPAEFMPTLAIDDSPRHIAAYRKRGVTTIAVRSHLTDHAWMPADVPVVLDLPEALKLIRPFVER